MTKKTKRHQIMYIDINNITPADVTIDVRTPEEFKSMPFFKHNVSVINKKDHNVLKKKIYLAIPIILKGLIKNKKVIKKQLLDLSCNKEKRIIIGCSRGRLRSPIIYIYAKILGIDAKVLKKGIKRLYSDNKDNLKNLYGFLDL